MRFIRLRHRLRRVLAPREPLSHESDFFAWEKSIFPLAAERDLVTHEHHKPNDYYGHATLLKRLVGQPLIHPLRLSIPHGLRFDSKLWEHDYRPDFPIGLVPGPFRASAIASRVNARLVPVGPLIHYAPPALSPAAHAAAASRLGRMLLVFPAHSTHHVDAEFSHNDFIAALTAHARTFDSVVVCLYWRDVLRGLAKPYKTAGFHVVTAGHIYDFAFLPRLRSMIELAAMTLSNRLGTHTGYCLHLGKPHHIHRQQVKIQIVHPEMVPVPGEMDEAVRFDTLFGEYSEVITPAQREIVEQYWGTSHVRPAGEMDALILDAEREFWRNHRASHATSRVRIS